MQRPPELKVAMRASLAIMSVVETARIGLCENGAVARFRDLGSINYFGNEEGVPLRPVGWLDGGLK
jgi:hypothetical protein